MKVKQPCQTLIAVAAAMSVAAPARAQLDNSVWPQFRANDEKTGAVAAAAPALNHAWTITNVGIPAPGGFTVAANGDIYYKSMDDDGCYVYRLNPADGSILMQSANLGGVNGSYSGVAVGVDRLYTTIFTSTGNTSIKVLNKSTLAVMATITNPAFQSLLGTPLLGTALNDAGHRNLYVADYGAVQLHAVDSVTGDLMWSRSLPAPGPLGAVGPMWEDGNGRQVIAHFGNAPFFGGSAIRDNGDNTSTELWVGGPDSFNWWGSGALSADGQRIYVTTFNDSDVAPLWAIDVNTGAILWRVPGFRGDPSREMNFFARPSVVGNRIYCGGANGVVACYRDDVSSATLLWEYRDLADEHTCISAVRAPDNKTYIYAVKQGLSLNPMRGVLIVLRDDGSTVTKLLETDLNGTMLPTIWSISSCTVDGDGGLYIGGGDPRTSGVGPAAVYKFAPGGGYRLSISGVCPGRVTIEWSGAPPRQQQGLLFARGTGNQVIPQGNPCAGTVLGLNGNQLRLVDPPGFFSTGNSGSGSFSGQASSGACGGFLQLIQGGSCALSNVVQVP